MTPIPRSCLLLVMLATYLPMDCGLTADASEEFDVEALRVEVKELTNETPAESGIRRLIEIDEVLAEDVHSVSLPELQQRILTALATSQDEGALGHVRSVFENAPERRGAAAMALAAATTQRPTSLQDWRYMVRSLPVVKGQEAVAVLKALQRFRTRANKGQWVRQVILVGLQLPADQQSAATELLRHWTGVPLRKADVGTWTLEKYQQWFVQEYPDQPAALLPVEPTGRKWTIGILEPAIQACRATEARMQQGAIVYQKAGCHKCHRRGKLGEALGPDLTTLGWRRQRREILLATLYPSYELNEEYPTVNVVLNSGRSLTGMLSASSADSLAIVSNIGIREQFSRKDIEDISNQKTSNMPDALLEPLSEDEVVSLIVWLSSVDGIPRPHTDDGP